MLLAEKRKPGTMAGFFGFRLHHDNLVMRLTAGLFRVADNGNNVEDGTQPPDQTQDHRDEDRHHDGSKYQTFD